MRSSAKLLSLHLDGSSDAGKKKLNLMLTDPKNLAAPIQPCCFSLPGLIAFMVFAALVTALLLALWLSFRALNRRYSLAKCSRKLRRLPGQGLAFARTLYGGHTAQS
ncbi:MAG: hypothetical protein NVS3B28_29470 [Candidatus Velthaea sp.]